MVNKIEKKWNKYKYIFLNDFVCYVKFKIYI